MLKRSNPRTEEILEPRYPIIDPHHHLLDMPGMRYLFDDLLEDVGAGHNILATVFIECGAMYRGAGPELMRPVGETEFVNGIAAMSASGNYGDCRACAGIVGYVDFAAGADAAARVLDAHVQAGGGRFRGVRTTSLWDADERTYDWYGGRVPKGLLLEDSFRDGFSQLAPKDLSFDSVLFYHQIPELANLAAKFPNTQIILNHCGFPLGIGPYAGRMDEVFVQWRRYVLDLARNENVMMKLGGLASSWVGFGYHERLESPSSAELAQDWKPYFEVCLEAFGSDRCMFESNFPVDGLGCGYDSIWNAFKRVTKGFSASEKADLFHKTAIKAYRLDTISAFDAPY